MRSLFLRGGSEVSRRKSGQDFCLIVYMYRAGGFFRACDGGHCRQEPSGVRQSFLACGVWGRFSRLQGRCGNWPQMPQGASP